VDNVVIYQNDHLGTPQKLTAVNGAVVWSAKYSSFGDTDVNSSSTVINNLRFPGQYFDEEAGLHYNCHRYYDPKVGRFLRVDPSHQMQPKGGSIAYLIPALSMMPQEFNDFSYVQNNSINFFDHLGLIKYQKDQVPPNIHVVIKLKCIELKLGANFSTDTVVDLSIGSGRRDGKGLSAHNSGEAADISTEHSILNGKNACDIAKAAIECGFKRAFQHKKSKHVHVDTDPHNFGGEAGKGGWKDYIDPCVTSCE